MALQISSQSLQYFQCPIINREANPTTDVVAIAFLASGVKPDGTETWNTSSWDSGSVAPVYLAQVLVAKSPGVVLAVGDYDAWVKVTDNPEIPCLGPFPLTVV